LFKPAAEGVLKRVVVFLFAFILYFTSDNLTAQQFEGVIDLTISTPSYEEPGRMESVVQRFYIKAPFIKIELEGEMSDVVVIVNNKERQMYVLDKGLERYTVNSFEEYAEEETFVVDDTEFEMRETDHRKQLLDYETELIEFFALGDTRESFDRIEVWVTRELNTLYRDLLIAMMGSDVQAKAWQTVLIEQALFPLQTTTFYQDNILEESNVTRIEPGAIEDKEFDIPTDYRKVDHRK